MWEDESIGRGPCPDCGKVDDREMTRSEAQAIKEMPRVVGKPKPPPFDLSRAMENGGRCLAGDRPARIVCTDFASRVGQPILVLVDDGNGEEAVEKYYPDGRYLEDPCDSDLRNLPEAQTVKVTLWKGKNGESVATSDLGAPGDIESYWKPYGTQTVTFPEGEGL